MAAPTLGTPNELRFEGANVVYHSYTNLDGRTRTVFKLQRLE